MRFSPLAWLGVSCLAVAPATLRAESAPAAVPVGVAQVDITPDYPVRLNGYGDRKTESQGVENRIKAKALAIGDDVSGVSVLLAVDNCGVPARLTEDVAGRLKRKVGLARERFVVCSSHTHSAPCLSNGLPFIFGNPLPPDQQGRIDRYTRELADALEKVALAALADRKPSTLSWAQGKVGFAANRRVLRDGRWVNFGVNPAGPVDHSMPVIRVADPNGKVRAVLVGYACHCTTLHGTFNKICGDWSGYACEELERSYPDALALVVIGCGADANPEPRSGRLDDAKQHGATVARETERLLKGTMIPLPNTIRAAYRQVELPFGTPRTREQLAEMARHTGPEGYFGRVMLERADRGEAPPRTMTYPVQTWCFGDTLGMVFLGGEVVVDYALRIKREGAADRLWVVAYSNDVPCYIASKRVIEEGGYEVDGSMLFYDRPSRLAPEAEDIIVNTVHELLPASFNTTTKR